MKLLQINCVFPNGSTGRITQQLHNAKLEKGDKSVVLYGRGKNIHVENCYKTSFEMYSKGNNLLSRFSGIMYGGCFFSTEYLISKIRKEKPDVIHIQCINGYFVNIYRLIHWLKKNSIPTVVTLHAEFMYTANCGHALECEKWKSGCGACPRLKQETKSLFWDNTARSFKKMFNAFNGFDNNLAIVSVSPWLMKRASQSLILKNKKHYCIYNGIDTNVFKYRDKSDLKLKLCKNGEALIFHATASFSDDENSLKGGIWLIRLAEKMAELPVRFVVAGKHNVKSKLPANVSLLGEILDATELANYYSAADLTLLVSKKETFSMIVAESLCCGTPVVGFKAGAPEQIAIKEYSSFVEQEDLDGLKSAVDYWLGGNIIKKDIAEYAAQIYSIQNMVEQYEDIYEQLCENK